MLNPTCKYLSSEYQTGQEKPNDPIKEDSVVEDCKKDLYDISWCEHIVRYVKKNISNSVSKFKMLHSN